MIISHIFRSIDRSLAIRMYRISGRHGNGVGYFEWPLGRYQTLYCSILEKTLAVHIVVRGDDAVALRVYAQVLL
jgi:hypothetical protein